MESKTDNIIKDFLMEKRPLDSEVFQAIRAQYLELGALRQKEKRQIA